MEPEKIQTSLPENAYRELKPGEEYTPVMPASSNPKEVTPYSVTMGVVMAVVFSAAAAFLGLKVGQVFEAAIPIAIIAVGMGSVLGKKNMLGQNVIIQSIGASSGVIVAGAIFTLPALYILGLDAAFWQVFLSSLFGGLLGIVLLIPFRKYFVKEMHGKYPFPEATATTEVLVSGEKGGSQAKLLAVAGLVGGLYDFVVGTFGLWTESVSTRICEWGAVAADKFKVVFGLNTSAAVLGLGYIIGLKYAMIITAGSCLVWFVIVPVVGSLAEAVDSAAMLSLLGVTRADIVADPQSIFTAENLFAFIGKPIGIGGIAMAGIIGIIRQSKIIRQAVGLAVSEFGGGKSAAAAPERTQRDISIKRILTILIATLISVFVFFHFGLLDGWVQSVTAILIVFIIAFLFTTVAANAIAIVGTNPVSGMTLMTLILSSLVLVSVGLSGTTGMTAALVIGGVVCTALSMAGGFITDLKIGYWLGTTPRKQEAWKFLGTFVAAATVAGVMIILNKSYGFVGAGGSAGQRHGGGDPAPDDRRPDPVDALFLRRCAGPCAHVDRRPGPRLRAGHVHPHGAERPAGGGRTGGLVRLRPLERRGSEQSPLRPRHADRLGIHRRRRTDGRGERRAEIRRRGLVPLRLGLVKRRRMDGPCDVPRFDRLLRLAHPAGQKGRITFNLQRQWT